MPKKSDSESKIIVITADELEGIRSGDGMLTKQLAIDVNQLGVNINLFLEQMSSMMEKTPESVGTFKLAEVEVSAQITGKGQVALWGIGGEVGAGGGLKFVFKR